MNKPNSCGKKALGSALVLAALAGMLALVSFAVIFSMVKAEDNTFVTGTVGIDLNGGQAIFSGADLANIEPGHSVVHTFTVENTGTVEVYYRLYLENISGPLADALTFSVYRGGKADAQAGTPLYTGPLSGCVAGGAPFVDDASLAVGETRTLTAVVKMEEGSGNTYQGGAVSFDITAQCVQARNNPNKAFG